MQWMKRQEEATLRHWYAVNRGVGDKGQCLLVTLGWYSKILKFSSSFYEKKSFDSQFICNTWAQAQKEKREACVYHFAFAYHATPGRIWGNQATPRMFRPSVECFNFFLMFDVDFFNCLDAISEREEDAASSAFSNYGTPLSIRREKPVPEDFENFLLRIRMHNRPFSVGSQMTSVSFVFYCFCLAEVMLAQKTARWLFNNLNMTARWRMGD